MALETEQVDLAALEQARVRRAMWRMAGNTTLRPNPMVLEDKRPGLVHVALEADRVLRGG